MTTYIIRRLFMAVITLWLVTLVVFFVLRLLPGDPLIIFLGQSATSGNMTAEQLTKMRADYGLDKPLVVQYLTWLFDIFRGNLGTSIHYHEQVSTLMLERFPITLHIGLVAFVLEAVLGVLLGLVAAVRRGTWIDTGATATANLLVTLPQFWLGLLLMYFFGLKLGWLPIAGYTSPFVDFWMSTKQIVMPVICLSIWGLAINARQMRSAMLEVIRQDYVRTAWSKGLRERTIMLRHALKPSLIPVMTLLGVGVSMVFGGSVIVETVFAIPGIGRLLVSSIFAQDYVVIQSGTLVIAAIIVLVNLIVDVSYGWIDPRIRYS
jgi:peptide/nickel transport system permease protein